MANVRRVMVSTHDDPGIPASDPSRCRAACGRFVAAGEALTCEVAHGSTDISVRYGSSDFIVCRLEKR